MGRPRLLILRLPRQTTSSSFGIPSPRAAGRSVKHPDSWVCGAEHCTACTRECHVVSAPTTLDRILSWSKFSEQEATRYRTAFATLRQWEERRKHPRRHGQWIQCEMPGCTKRRWIKDKDVHRGRPRDGWAHDTAHARLLEFRRGFRRDALGGLLHEALLATGSPSALATALGMSLAGCRKLCQAHREKYKRRASKTVHLPIGPLETDAGDGFLQRLSRIVGRPVSDLRRYVPQSGADNIGPLCEGHWLGRPKAPTALNSIAKSLACTANEVSFLPRKRMRQPRQRFASCGLIPCGAPNK